MEHSRDGGRRDRNDARINIPPFQPGHQTKRVEGPVLRGGTWYVVFSEPEQLGMVRGIRDALPERDRPNVQGVPARAEYEPQRVDAMLQRIRNMGCTEVILCDSPETHEAVWSLMEQLPNLMRPLLVVYAEDPSLAGAWSATRVRLATTPDALRDLLAP